MKGGTYVWGTPYSFRSAPAPGENTLQRVIIFGGWLCTLKFVQSVLAILVISLCQPFLSVRPSWGSSNVLDAYPPLLSLEESNVITFSLLHWKAQCTFFDEALLSSASESWIQDKRWSHIRCFLQIHYWSWVIHICCTFVFSSELTVVICVYCAGDMGKVLFSTPFLSLNLFKQSMTPLLLVVQNSCKM